MTTLLQLRSDLAALEMRWALTKLTYKYNFDPAQPRVPAGSRDGGQWTGTGGDGWVRVAANDRGEGGIAMDAQVSAKPRKLHRIDAVPQDAAVYRTPDGTRFFAPKTTNFEDVYNAGKLILSQNANTWPDYIGQQVGQFGKFDFQRQGGNFYSQYTDASNYAAGLFMNGAGFSYRDTIAIAGGYAALHSSGGITARRVLWWTYGYMAGYLKSSVTPLPSATKASCL